MDRLVNTIGRLFVHYTEIVTALGAISGEINGHVRRSLTLLAVCLNLKSILKLVAFR
jgi:hypothetical protein